MGKVVGTRYSLLAATVLLVVLVAALTAGCGSQAANDPGDAQLGALDIKHTIDVNSLVCPLVEIGDVGAAPDSGMKYAQLELSIANVSGQKFIFSPADLSLETWDGASYNFDLEFEGQDILPAINTIDPGDSLAGAVVFQIPVDAVPSALVEDVSGQVTRIGLPAAS